MQNRYFLLHRASGRLLHLQDASPCAWTITPSPCVSFCGIEVDVATMRMWCQSHHWRVRHLATNKSRTRERLQVGDRIVIASSSFYGAEVDEATITSITAGVNSTSITVDTPMAYTHLGQILTDWQVQSGHVIDMRAEVAVLSRNIVFQVRVVRAHAHKPVKAAGFVPHVPAPSLCPWPSGTKSRCSGGCVGAHTHSKNCVRKLKHKHAVVHPF